MFEGAGCSLWKEGREEAFLESIRNLSAHLNLSSAQALEVLCIPLKERRRLQALLTAPKAKRKGESNPSLLVDS